MSCFSESVRLYLKPPTSMPYDEHNHYRSRLSCINPTTARTPIKTPSKNQYKVLKSTTSLNGKHQPNLLSHQPNHYPSCPTIYSSCPTITPLAQPLLLLPNHYPSCPTIYPSCPTITPLAQPLLLLRCHNQPFDFITVSHLFCF